MRSIALLLLWSLVEVQSRTEYPYVYFRGHLIHNHSYVDLGKVWDIPSGSDNNTVQCRTDLETCCRNQSGFPGRGDWFAPGSDTRLPFGNDQAKIYEDRKQQVVHLKRRHDAVKPNGIYRCIIPTNAVHSNSDPSVGETVYVGLYYGSNRGMIVCNNNAI